MQPVGSANGASGQQPGGCGAPPPRDPSGLQLHVKMCKKIAQLTKVIYALNMKNDEQEASLEALKEAYEKEIEDLMAETKEKLPHFQSRAGEEPNLGRATEQEKQQTEHPEADSASGEKPGEGQEPRMEAGGVEESPTLCKQAPDLKGDLEEKSQPSNQGSESFTSDCGGLQRENRETAEEEATDLREEMNNALGEMEKRRTENQNLIADSAQKTRDLQACYEKENEALRKVMQQYLKQWQQKEAELRKSFRVQEVSLQTRVTKLQTDLETKGQKATELKKYSLKLKERIQDLETQLTEAGRESLESRNTIKKLREELAVLKERPLLQEWQILSKADEVKTAPGSPNLKDDEAEVSKFRGLRFQPEQLTTGRTPGPAGSEHAQMLRKTREVATVEKGGMKQRYEEELRGIKRQTDEEKLHFKEQFVKGLEDLVKEHTTEINSFQSSMEAERKKLRKEVQEQLEELKKKSETEIKQLEEEKASLNEKLQESLLEVLRLQDFIRQSRDGSEYVELLQPPCRTAPERLQELDQETSRIAEQQCLQQKKLSKIPTERGKSQEQLPTKVIIGKEENERSGSPGTVKTVQSPLPTAFPKEVSEIQSLQEGWQSEKADLQAQISRMKQMLDQRTSRYQEELQELKLLSVQEKEKLLQELQDRTEQSQNVQAQLEASHHRALKVLEKSKIQELQEVEERLKEEYNQSIKIQHRSHQMEIKALEDKASRDLVEERERSQKQQALLLDSMKLEISEQRGACTRHQKQLEEVQLELAKSRGLKRQQEGSNQNQISSLTGELEKCQSDISGLKKENSLLKDALQLLRTEAESQKQEAERLQDRQRQHRRLLDEDLQVKHQKELETMKQDHKKEIQTMVSDFSSVQAHLQAKIVSLETELKDSEEKPRKRESRAEDLHLIGRLQDRLSEREEVIRQLTVSLSAMMKIDFWSQMRKKEDFTVLHCKIQFTTGTDPFLSTLVLAV
ncbi:protein FAM184B isoform X2 [Tachyglossus aculeatus]|uniref:protein FAM184B isoform X2 n=1 Tax=Tachyglossus aculeatus TaxID=9261 RepID=UPI0018F78686|nr:protein FAM184B isoform X2 [Tachyglossus aculeatus]